MALATDFVSLVAASLSVLAISAVCFEVCALGGASFGGSAGGLGTKDANPSLGTACVSAGGLLNAFAPLGMLLNSREGRPSAIATEATSAALIPTNRGIQVADCERAGPNFFLTSAISRMKGGSSNSSGSEGGGGVASANSAKAGGAAKAGAAKACTGAGFSTRTGLIGGVGIGAGMGTSRRGANGMGA